MYDATLPDHAHKHTHNGIPTGHQTYNIQYRSGPEKYTDSGKALGWNSGSGSKKHNHNEVVTETIEIDFGKMKPSDEDFNKPKITNITNPKVSKSTAENDLYSAHMRVVFYFKCL